MALRRLLFCPLHEPEAVPGAQTAPLQVQDSPQKIGDLQSSHVLNLQIVHLNF